MAPEKVLRLAGYLPLKPQVDEAMEEILYFYQQMDGRTRQNFHTIARALAEGGKRSAG